MRFKDILTRPHPPLTSRLGPDYPPPLTSVLLLVSRDTPRGGGSVLRFLSLSIGPPSLEG